MTDGQNWGATPGTVVDSVDLACLGQNEQPDVSSSIKRVALSDLPTFECHGCHVDLTIELVMTVSTN